MIVKQETWERAGYSRDQSAGTTGGRAT